MAQLININSTEFRRCNLSAIQSGGTWASIVPDKNEIILISTTNLLTADGSGECDAYIKGDGTTLASALELKRINGDLEEEIDDLVNRFTDVENVSDNFDSYIWAYMNATNGNISAQAETSNRKLLFYRVLAGDKFRVTGILQNMGTNIYTYIGYYEGDTAPVAGNRGVVIEAYGAAQKTVDRELTFPENGWLIIGLTTLNQAERWQGLDWQVYKNIPVDYKEEIEANTAAIADIDERLTAVENQTELVNSLYNGNYNSYIWAYLNANNGTISAQAESTYRRIFLFKVKTGEKYHISAELVSASTLFGFLGFYAGDTAPVVWNTAVVLESYAATAKSVERELTFSENGWLMVATYNNVMDARYRNADLKVYKAEALDNSIGGLFLPSKLSAVVGDTMQIFKRSLFKGINPNEYDIKAKCTQGRDFPRYWEIAPTSAGTIQLQFDVLNYKRQSIAEAKAEVTIKAAPTSPSSMKRIAVFGDSLTQAGTWVAEAARRLLSSDAATATMPAGKHLSNLRFIGAMGTGNARYYGVGGWSWKSYTIQGSPAFRFQVTGVSSIVKGAKYTNNGHTYEVVENNTTNGSGNILCTTSAVTNTPTASGTLTRSSGTGDATITFTSAAADAANPLWDSQTQAISFQKYLSNIGESSVDCVVFLLGWNDMGADKTDFSEVQGYMETLIGALHTQFPNAIVKIMGLQLPSLNGGLADNYGSNGGYADKYGVIRSVFNYNEFLQSFCESEDYNSYVSYVDVASQFDSENNMPENSVQVNTRNAKTEERGTNGVHPANAGYYQIADVIYRDIVKTYC